MERPAKLQQIRSALPSAAYAELEVDYYKVQFVKMYLYKVFSGRINDETLEVERLLARTTNTLNRLRPLTIHDTDDEGGCFISDDLVDATVYFGREPYDITLSGFLEDRMRGVRYFITALGLSERSNKPTGLIQFLVQRGLEHSTYKNKFLTVNTKAYGDDEFRIRIAQLEKTTLSDIFLPSYISEQLDVYVHCIKNYAELKQPLRYLLSGRPGTAKTKIIRAIANEAKGHATFIFTDGSETRIDNVYELAESFSPVVLCIDDVDLIVGNRDAGLTYRALAKFLQRLDGFLSSGVFVLATTNDKSLVDAAASRPGRFDLILDVGSIDPAHYLRFMRTKTDNQEVLSLFQEEVLDALEARKVTGAFLAALIKHLEILSKLGERKVDIQYVIDRIEKMNIGFYKEPSDELSTPGFRLS
jgi:hypothetical protein